MTLNFYVIAKFSFMCIVVFLGLPSCPKFMFPSKTADSISVTLIGIIIGKKVDNLFRGHFEGQICKFKLGNKQIRIQHVRIVLKTLVAELYPKMPYQTLSRPLFTVLVLDYVASSRYGNLYPNKSITDEEVPNYY